MKKHTMPGDHNCSTTRRSILAMAATTAATVVASCSREPEQPPNPLAPSGKPQVEGPHTVTAIAMIPGAAGYERELQAELLSLSEPTRSEAGCLLYDLYQSTEHPHRFMRLERWTSVAELDAHRALPHVKASQQKRKDAGWTTGTSEVTVWRRVG